MRYTFIQDYVEIQALLKTGIELEMCLRKEARGISNVIATFGVERTQFRKKE